MKLINLWRFVDSELKVQGVTRSQWMPVGRLVEHYFQEMMKIFEKEIRLEAS